MTDVLETGESGLVIVAVNKLGSEVEPLLSHADKVVIDDMVQGDLATRGEGHPGDGSTALRTRRRRAA